ncbi:NfeD family protein [Hoyosella rhizosphaerae]|uniref:NfeD family protein n=1 Tax=Hoyosella rhizosphaerae TaxID=1755582 RepID=UPI00166449E7|nr:NfeD family protein [Hoyosella rhizosphaerae]MBN4926524.1 NfeD family protein [Hoyosella rhizosphaerae]
MTALLWFIGAAVLAVGEMVVGEFFLLMLAGAALATAGFSAVFDFPIWVDALFFLGTSVALLLGVRPLLVKKLHSHPAIEGTVAELEGKSAVVTQEVSATAGQVRLSGDLWTARPIDPTEQYPPGTDVIVAQIQGSTAIVWRQP